METRLIGIRGATTAERDDPTAIAQATSELIQEMLGRNTVEADDLVDIFFSATPDITTAFPAAAARMLGFHDVPLFGSCELDVVGAPARCIRVLIHCYAAAARAGVHHVYIHGAAALRRDLAN